MQNGRIGIKKQETDYTEKRQYVGNIIIAVLTERISVKKGLLLFPKGCEDPSINAAWHALCHYEADEDIKAKDIEFNNQIIDAYEPFYHNTPVSYEKGIRGFLKSLLRFINF